MTTTITPTASRQTDHESAISAALGRIPPLWPLNHFVAVNPFVGLTNLPFAEASEILQRTVGVAPMQNAADYLAAYRSGAITPAELASVADAEWTVEKLLSAVEAVEGVSGPGQIATMADLLDRERPHAHWSVFVVEEISKWCGVAFDENQTTWNSPWKALGLYAAWRQAAIYDRNPEAFGLSEFRAFVASLPEDSEACIRHCLAVLDPQDVDLTEFLHRQLATISGWAGYVQYLVREDGLREKKNDALRDLLAMRLAYDAALVCAFARDGVLRTESRHFTTPHPVCRTTEALVRWQTAFESGYQSRMACELVRQPSHTPETRPSAQAVFCIDVRSEIYRRHLETALPGVQTVGFAGFFGFPVAHRTPAAIRSTARCPVLLVPPVESGEPLCGEAAAAAVHSKAAAGAWKAFQNSATSCFSFVESVGLTFGGVLARLNKGGESCCGTTPELENVPVSTRADLAEGALRNMSLTSNFARLVLICGHGSRSTNNPYASALDCGACGGHAGDVNARLAAATLNEPGVRTLIAQRGIVIPEDTVFVGGMHQTLSDDVTLFADGPLPATHAKDFERLKNALVLAGAGARKERAASLGLGDVADADLDGAIRSRALDISQVRPEWGLAGNAALIAAPRSRTASLKLDGRVFLHNYDAGADPEDNVLTLILCAPVVVASWINLQYYASRVAPLQYGSGNKVLHNVVGGIGVMEGNAGDLRVGLPLQSIHDGEKFVHEPRRLTVFLEAARSRIDAVLDAQPPVRELFDNGWIHLVALEGAEAWKRSAGQWNPVAV